MNESLDRLESLFAATLRSRRRILAAFTGYGLCR